MKKILLPLSLMLTGLAAAQEPAPLPAPLQAAPAQAAPAQLRQVHIAVRPFECGAGTCNPQLAAGIADALTNALIQSSRFSVYERSALGDGLREGMFSGADAGSQVQGADVLVTGTVTAYGENSSGKSACFLGLCGGAKEERVAATLRIFDVKTSRIIGSTQVEGKSTANSASLNFGGFSLGGNQSSGMDKAMNAMLVDAVNKLAATIPDSYYR